MNNSSDLHHRRSIRLKGYDYSQAGAYFITTCVQNHNCIFGKITDGKMEMNKFAYIVQEVWEGLPDHYPHCGLGPFVVMPNHFHGIIILDDLDIGADLKHDQFEHDVGAGFKPAPTKFPAKWHFPTGFLIHSNQIE